MARTIIRHIQGNEITMVIPLTRRKVSVTDGTEAVTEDVQLPAGAAKVRLSRGPIRLDLSATVSGNTVVMKDSGTVPVGRYDITVLCKDADGRPMRFKQDTVLEVVETTDEGGSYANDEFDVIAYYPVVNGRRSAIVIEDGKIYLEVGGHFGEDDDPDDGKAMISTGYGAGRVVREDGKIILYI